MSEENMRKALDGLLERYVDLVNSGDAGNWDPEKEKVVIAARAVLSIAPSSALLAHDNEVAAKALEEAQGIVMSAIGMSDAVSKLREMATERRNRK